MSTVSTARSRPIGSDILRQRVAAALDGLRPPRGASVVYSFMLLVTAFLTLLLPLIYFSIIVLAAWLLWLHIRYDWVVMVPSGRTNARIMLLAVLLYVGPIIAGVIFIFFMFKPFIAPACEETIGPTLTEDEQPVLFDFLRRLSAATGAPMPKRVEVDCQLNAHVRFRRGLISLIVPSDAVMRIGLPLVTGMSVSQFASVMAHELGHMAQGFGWRANYLITAVNIWLARAVYERDQWDYWLQAQTGSESTWIIVIARLTQLLVWGSRRVLWVLLFIGGLVSMAMSRQMEYDADRYSKHVTGSKGVEGSMTALARLSLAQDEAGRSLGDLMKEGRLCDNLPLYVAARSKSFTDEQTQVALKTALRERFAGIFDTHPSMAQRLRRATRRPVDAALDVEDSAVRLFDKFEFIAKAATYATYSEMFGDHLEKLKLIPTADLWAKDQTVNNASTTLDRFMGLTIGDACLPSLGPQTLKPPANAAQTFSDLKRARLDLANGRDAAAEAYKEVNALAESQVVCWQAAQLLSVRVPIPSTRYVPKSPEEARQMLANIKSRMGELGHELAPFQAALRVRIISALSLLFAPAIAQRVDDAPGDIRHAQALLEALRAIESVQPILDELRSDCAVITAIIAHFQKGSPNEMQAGVIAKTVSSMHARASRLQATLREAKYPFETKDDWTSIGRYVLGAMIPPRTEPAELCQAAIGGVERLTSLRRRVLGELAVIAERVEAAAKLPALVT